MTSVASLLLDTASRKELHHAIILHGPSRARLRSVAIDIARRLLCANPSCGGDCVSCGKVARGIHPDLHLVVPAEDRKLISTEQVRDIVGSAFLRPYEADMKVFVIDPADAMSTAAANALLKTLEEPTRQTSFVLVTRSPDLLLPTIRSRSQAVYIGPAAESAGGPATQSSRIRAEIDLLGGDVEEAEALARETLEALARFASRRETAALLQLAGRYGSCEPASDAVLLLASVLRDLAACHADYMLDPDLAGSIQEKISRASLLDAAAAAVQAVQRFKVNVDVRMAVEQALLKLVR